ncbi:GNAT family N-acetyltransferase [Streptomyces lunaelactis]|uniref:GNAT family N-acetyltransferase n=1 Tax=Streptomyces lunaelactis TaxID=1535768 RepID=UPI001585459B|nr:GNAT family N-acetyltransferase [Streptomyces lunaelactis]NUL07120.1 GNAT family N-acetyltransferase [Streptomyces lunaelactis]
MTTTLRPTGPIQHEANGATSRSYEVCVNSRPVGAVEIGTDARFGPRGGVIRSLRIDEPDRRRGRGTVAALAAEEVLRGWGCTQVGVSVPADAATALRMASALGYTERGRNMLKELPPEPPALPAGVEGRPMSEAEYERWLVRAIDSYAQNWIDRGVPEEQARAKSLADHTGNLPDGLATAGTWFSVLTADGAVVGHVWVAAREVRPGEQGTYVFDVEVAEEFRGRGHGRALMLLAERVSREAGAELLGLHVFAGNTPAIRLYESLGYETTAVNLFKQLL